MRAYLVLEDGSIYEGNQRGAFRETACEVVFNTSMTGYLEVLTDPSYVGQGIVMAYPMIGNYGISRDDFESTRLHPRAFIVHELCDKPSNFRSTGRLEDLLVEFDIPCISDVDTRAVVKRLRDNGTMRGVVTDDISDMPRLMDLITSFEQIRPVESVSIEQSMVLGTENTGPSVALLDCGTVYSLPQALVSRGCKVTQYPFFTTAEEILAGQHDGVLLSSGPGDPAGYADIIKQIKKLYDLASPLPIFGVGLGHQLLALAAGGKTEKINHGHRGTNYPVKFLDMDKTFITAQNHGYAVSAKGLPHNAQVNCINVNDGSVEGISYHDKPAFSIQFYPKASSCSQDSAFLFDRFIIMMGEDRHND
ncbi:MAG TPA: carbamoyl phosphate synthase small subunit [Clostridia bacterium]|nr:carbamoyl phosphate synthase small subunit [Clostridia bacterium]